MLDKAVFFLTKLKEYILVLGFFASIFVGSVALVVTVRFAPVFESLDDLAQQVEATEERLSEYQSNSNDRDNASSVVIEKYINSSNAQYEKMSDVLSNINQRLSRIEGKLE